MNSRSALIILYILMLSIQVMAQEGVADGAPERKEMRAIRIENGSIDIDGRLADAAWQKAKFVNDFLQVMPVEFGVPEQGTEFGILYDDDAIYIGARMFVADPASLRMDLSRRDDRGLGEQLIVTIDSYLDRRTGYGFGVTTAGVRFDRYNAADNQRHDFSWDVVWEAETSLDDKSWIAEMRIPFSQLRFNDVEQQVWGINVNRWIPTRNEDIFWVVIPPSETGWASRFGNLVGIEGIKPSRRLELLPYLAGEGKFSNDTKAGDPFDDGSRFTGRLGGDLKMGLGPNLTLDATFNPDFGQVEADPAEVNLTAFETRFSERRPFFLEGIQLFDAIGPNYFYSRRIGAQPRGSVLRGATSALAHGNSWGRDFVDSPLNTTILGASKVTGRLKSGTSVAALVAVTDAEYADFQDSLYVNPVGDTLAAMSGRTKVQPTTTYGVLRMKQELGEGGSTAGFILTGVKRDMDEGDPLAARLTKDAFSGGLDYHLRLDEGMYSIYSWAGFSHVRGSKEAILAKQLSSAHYFQRIDASHVSVDSNRTSLTGYTGGISIEKDAGDHWVWETGVAFDSPELELNDAGILRAADDIDSWAELAYRETRLGETFRNYKIELSTNSGWNFDHIRQYTRINLDLDAMWLNYMITNFSFNYSLGGLSDNMTRGGPLMRAPSSWSASSFISNNMTANTRWSLNVWYRLDEFDGYGYSFSPQMATRIGDKIELSIRPSYDKSNSKRKYIGTATRKNFSTPDYVFSSLLRSEVRVQIRASYFFSPDLALELYAEPFAASGHYYDYGTLRHARSKFLDPQDSTSRADNFDSFATDGDFGNRSFRSTMVLRWEFMLGSTAYLVWSRNMSDKVEAGKLVRPGSLTNGFSGKGTDMVALKVSYWLPVT